MVCNSCGRSNTNENANFCDYCGASYKEVIFIKNEDNQSNGTQSNNTQSIDAINKVGSVAVEEESPISFGNWMGSLLLPFIPIVGPIINLVMLLIWAFGGDTSKSKKNWARANLITVIISLVLIIVVIVLFISFSMSTYTELINSGFDMEGYMNQMN